MLREGARDKDAGVQSTSASTKLLTRYGPQLRLRNFARRAVRPFGQTRTWVVSQHHRPRPAYPLWTIPPRIAVRYE